MPQYNGAKIDLDKKFNIASSVCVTGFFRRARFECYKFIHFITKYRKLKCRARARARENDREMPVCE